jgi:hypothetical protein
VADRPRIITARSIGLAFQNLFGQLGPERFVTGHYSAGSRARSWREGVARARSFHADHRDNPEKRWGGIGYHYVIADDGALICARPTILKGAHTGGANTSNIGVNCPGTTGDRPTPQQKATYQWLLANAHTNAMPKAHRTDVDLRQAQLRGHKQWPGHASNGCPGLFMPMYLAGLKRFEEEIPEEELDETVRRGDPGDYPKEERFGTTVANYRHVSPEEAKEARNADEVPAELPEEDPDFDEKLSKADLGSDD